MYEGPDLTVTASIPSSAVWLGQESHRKIQLTALNLEKQLGEAWKAVVFYGAWALSDATPPKRKTQMSLKKGPFQKESLKVVFLFQFVSFRGVRPS